MKHEYFYLVIKDDSFFLQTCTKNITSFLTCSSDEQMVTLICPSVHNESIPIENDRKLGCVQLAISFYVECNDEGITSSLFF